MKSTNSAANCTNKPNRHNWDKLTLTLTASTIALIKQWGYS